jgi:hypothetical protein
MQWMDRLGDYEVLNNKDELIAIEKIRLRYRDGLLVLELSTPEFEDFPSTTALIPVSDTELIFAGLGRSMGETVGVATINGQERILYCGYQSCVIASQSSSKSMPVMR